HAHDAALLQETQAAPAFKQALQAAFERAAAFAAAAVEANAEGERLARTAASALYNSFTAIAMAWEAGRIGSAERLRWAQLVLVHRVLPRDPLQDMEIPPDWAQ